MIPVPKGRNPLLVKRYKLSFEDQLQVGQRYSTFLSEQSETLIEALSIGFAEPRNADRFRLLR